MSFPRHERYQNSGDERLGEVPSGWAVTRFSRIIRAIKDGTHGTFVRTDIGKPLLSAKNVQNGYIETSDDESLISDKDFNEITSNGFPKMGDLLLTIVGTIGRSCVYKFKDPIAFQRSVCFIRLIPGVLPEYFFYFTQSIFFQEQLESRSKSAAQGGIYMGDVSATTVAYPLALSDQHVVVRFLDSECARINDLLAEQNRLIDILKEKRQAVISHAVTKGLDPNAPMKDSGIEWLGEVPQSWEVLTFARVIRTIEQGWSPIASSEPCEANSWGVLKLGAIKNGVFIPEENKMLLNGIEPDLTIEVKPGDFLVTRGNTPELVGDACVVTDFAGYRLMLSDLIYRIKLTGDNDPIFFCNLLISKYGRSLIETDARGSSMSMAKISQSHIRSWVIPIPPSKDQSAIVAFISTETARVNALVAEAQVAIDLLKERRSALISAAVTGKIDIRGLVANKSE